MPATVRAGSHRRREAACRPKYIVAIIGVETSYGGFTGNHRILDALYARL